MLFFPYYQLRYKEGGKKDLSSSLYSRLPETTEIQFAKEVAEMQSEVSSETLCYFPYKYTFIWKFIWKFSVTEIDMISQELKSHSVSAFQIVL